MPVKKKRCPYAGAGFSGVLSVAGNRKFLPPRNPRLTSPAMTVLPELKHLRVGLAIIISKGRVLIAKRKKSDSLGGFWEFPGGKCEPTETLEECVRREVAEELAIEVTPLRALDAIGYRYPTAVVM